MIDHLKSLAVFAKTVEHGSFRGAARELALSPSVVSHHISSLERTLASRLLHRSTRHLSLTPEGQALYASSREMLAAAQRGLDVLQTTSGHLRMSAPAFLAETGFCRELAAFARKNENVRLSIAFSEVRSDLLRDNIDLAIRIGPLPDSSFKARKLADMRRVLVASPQYLDGRAKPKSIEDLADWDFIRLSAVRPELALLPPKKKTPRTISYEPRISVDSATGMREMAIAGLGLASQPEVLARSELARGRLVEVLPGWKLPSMPVWAVWPDGSAQPRLTVRFVEFIGERLATLLG